MLDDPRILEAERTGYSKGGTWVGLGGEFEGVKMPLADGSPDKGQKKTYSIKL